MPKLRPNGLPYRKGIGKAYDKAIDEYNEPVMIVDEDGKKRELEYKSPSWEEMKELAHGRESKYGPDKAELAFKLYCDPHICFTVGAIQNRLGITDTSWYEWLEKHPDFKMAVEQGRREQEARFATRLAQGFRFAPGMQFVMKNLHDWKDKTENVTTLQLGQALANDVKDNREVAWVDIEAAPAAARLEAASAGQGSEPADPDEEDAETSE